MVLGINNDWIFDIVRHRYITSRQHAQHQIIINNGRRSWLIKIIMTFVEKGTFI
jgi:hypothetical protein